MSLRNEHHWAAPPKAPRRRPCAPSSRPHVLTQMQGHRSVPLAASRGPTMLVPRPSSQDPRRVSPSSASPPAPAPRVVWQTVMRRRT